jgi:hypothetical protein
MRESENMRARHLEGGRKYSVWECTKTVLLTDVLERPEEWKTADIPSLYSPLTGKCTQVGVLRPRYGCHECLVMLEHALCAPEGERYPPIALLPWDTATFRVGHTLTGVEHGYASWPGGPSNIPADPWLQFLRLKT